MHFIHGKKSYISFQKHTALNAKITPFKPFNTNLKKKNSRFTFFREGKDLNNPVAMKRINSHTTKVKKRQLVVTNVEQIQDLNKPSAKQQKHKHERRKKETFTQTYLSSLPMVEYKRRNKKLSQIKNNMLNMFYF